MGKQNPLANSIVFLKVQRPKIRRYHRFGHVRGMCGGSQFMCEVCQEAVVWVFFTAVRAPWSNYIPIESMKSKLKYCRYTVKKNHIKDLTKTVLSFKFQIHWFFSVLSNIKSALFIHCRFPGSSCYFATEAADAALILVLAVTCLGEIMKWYAASFTKHASNSHAFFLTRSDSDSNRKWWFFVWLAGSRRDVSLFTR